MRLNPLRAANLKMKQYHIAFKSKYANKAYAVRFVYDEYLKEDIFDVPKRMEYVTFFKTSQEAEAALKKAITLLVANKKKPKNKQIYRDVERLFIVKVWKEN